MVTYLCTDTSLIMCSDCTVLTLINVCEDITCVPYCISSFNILNCLKKRLPSISCFCKFDFLFHEDSQYTIVCEYCSVRKYCAVCL